MLDFLSEDDIDFVVLARYVQILTRGFIDACGLNLIINIHHSFLPAFVGWLLPPRPRQGRHDRRVIACYITADPDTGSIANQDISHATHRDTVDDLTSYAHEVERGTPARAIRWHLEDCMLVDGERTTVFERD